MRYRLRTLLIVLAFLPPLIAMFVLWGFINRPQVKTEPPKPGYLGAAVDETPIAGQGVAVTFVRQPSPAQAGGLMEGDVITAVNNKPCRNLDDFTAIMRQSTADRKLTMKVTRNGKTEDIVVTLGKIPTGTIVGPVVTPQPAAQTQKASPDEN